MLIRKLSLTYLNSSTRELSYKKHDHNCLFRIRENAIIFRTSNLKPPDAFSERKHTCFFFVLQRHFSSVWTINFQLSIDAAKT